MRGQGPISSPPSKRRGALRPQPAQSLVVVTEEQGRVGAAPRGLRRRRWRAGAGGMRQRTASVCSSTKMASLNVARRRRMREMIEHGWHGEWNSTVATSPTKWFLIRP